MDEGVVMKNFFDCISCNLLELKELKVINCENVISDSDLEALGKLINLEVLVVLHLQDITGSDLSCFLNLKELNCNACYALNYLLLGIVVKLPMIH